MGGYRPQGQLLEQSPLVSVTQGLKCHGDGIRMERTPPSPRSAHEPDLPGALIFCRVQHPLWTTTLPLKHEGKKIPLNHSLTSEPELVVLPRFLEGIFRTRGKRKREENKGEEGCEGAG